MATVTVVFGGQEQKTYSIDKPKMLVGREPSCDIHIDNLGISRQHCAFSTRGEAFIVQDLGSSNGTFVNGRKVTEHFLNNDDEVVIGKYTLKFKNESQPVTGNAAAVASSEVPDTLNTYVMDGNKIQEQLAKMRAAQGIPAGAKAGEEQPAVAATAKDYARALDVPAAPASGEMTKLKTFIIALASVVVVLLIVIVLMMVGIIKVGG